MPNWLSVIILIVVVAGVALLRETWRQRGVNAFMTATGLRRLGPTERDWQAVAAPLVALMHASGARIWGLAVTGTLDGVPVTIAEHESSRGISQDSRWYTLVVWPLLQRADGAIVLSEASNATVTAVTTAISTLGTGVRISEQLGITDPVPEESRPVRAGRFDVSGAPTVRGRWLTESRVAMLDRLPPNASFVRGIDHAAWRFEGTITSEGLERILAEFAMVRSTLDATP